MKSDVQESQDNVNTTYISIKINMPAVLGMGVFAANCFNYNLWSAAEIGAATFLGATIGSLAAIYLDTHYNLSHNVSQITRGTGLVLGTYFGYAAAINNINEITEPKKPHYDIVIAGENKNNAAVPPVQPNQFVRRVA